MPAGLRAVDMLGVLREARSAAAGSTTVAVTGVLAAELARALRADGGASSAVRVGEDPADAAALVVVLAGAPGEAEDRAMRQASRLGVPVVAVQTDPRAAVALPYVLATEVVECPPGRGFPIRELARVLARRLGHDAVGVAARLPVLRDEVAAELVRTAALRAALIGAAPWRRGADFPPLTLLQSRLVLDLGAVYGHPVDGESAVELGAVAGSGIGLRALVRWLPRRLPLLGAVTGYLGTRALGEAAIRRYA